MSPLSETVRAILALALATLGSEDLTCVAAGQLAAAGRITWAAAVLGCAGGIYVGDLGLWLLGRTMGRGMLRWNWIVRRVPSEAIDRFGNWLARRGAWAIIAARFLPGTRLPLYVAAGAVGRRPIHFALWSLLAVVLWTPAIVLFAGLVGEAAARPLRLIFGGAWIIGPFAALVVYLVVRLVALAITEMERQQLHARISRIWRWEFWPSWLFYLPMVPWIIALAIRYRGFSTITAANPSIPAGGFVGESKVQILSSLKSPHVAPSALIKASAPGDRVACFRELIEQRGWNFPLVLKPDVGERGAGVRLARDLHAAASYLTTNLGATVVQPYDPGPFEAGVFYYRLPHSSSGRIFSITDKRFPDVVGDGASTLEELIWRHPRYRMQARTFLRRHSDQRDRVLATGEHFRLAMAGNHCQGTQFCDGSHLITLELERAIDRVARSCEGLFFGRFDVRYSDVQRFTSGEQFTIIELNGVTSESTNIYDPSRSLWWAYRTLARQWRLLFRIGAENRQRGHATTSLSDLLQGIAKHLWTRRIETQSD